ncbi:MAG: Uma2 family endonuclease [Pseudomonadota bacterium]
MAQLKRTDDLISVDDYLAGEALSEIRHEFVNGRVYAMAGASKAHTLIVANMTAALVLRAADDCRTFPTELKLEVKLRNDIRYYYPNLVVACGLDDNTSDRRSDARIIIEVLSPSTERTDRFEKFDAYKQIETLEEYVLVDQSVRRVEVYRRANDWMREAFSPPDLIDLNSIGVSMTFDEIYRRLPDIPAPTPRG